MRLILVGPPGAGEGTQTAILSEKFSAPHISAGDLFYASIGEGTPLSIGAKSYIDTGNLVPGDAIVHMVKSRLNEDDAIKGFLLDGFPRTVGQTEELKCLLSSLGIKLDAVVQFDVSEDAVVERMLARGRADDTEEVIRNRMRVYINETASSLDYHSEEIIKAAAKGSVEEINERMMAELEKLN